MKKPAKAKALSTSGKAATASRRPVVAARPRVSAAERETLILAEAVRFFAEVGFSGDTRELARRAHVTHPLLYKYFATKEALIERVYQAVYLGRWNQEWEALIADRRLSVRDRMGQFYAAFALVILDREWVRLFMFFGLRGADMNQRWFAVMREKLVLPFCAEIRHEQGLPSIHEAPPTIEETELIQGISTRIFSFGIRQHIYGMPLPGDGKVASLIRAELDVFFDGIGPTLQVLVPPAPRTRTPARQDTSGQPTRKTRARRA
ncbi:TetR/AcrR family transcriptional regulator [Variovorax boronicumulans]|uniref:TetR/AcrR family transcriptional regulator n=1 Tax=Variovorax boronicumulans TaxID=436515 RepID=UPI001C583990